MCSEKKQTKQNITELTQFLPVDCGFKKKEILEYK